MSSNDFTGDRQPPDEWDRLIDRALREERDGLPENFAAQTAAFVEAANRSASDRLELWLQRAAIAALIMAAIITLFLTGARVLAALAPILGAGWIYTVALCVGLSLALQHFAQRRIGNT
jgi:hypothetical protein